MLFCWRQREYTIFAHIGLVCFITKLYGNFAFFKCATFSRPEEKGETIQKSNLKQNSTNLHTKFKFTGCGGDS